MKTEKQIKSFKRLITALSILIPVAVAALFKLKIEGVDTSFLPPIYATINGITAVLLILAVIAIKKGNRNRHENLIKSAMICSVLFLLMYVTYHITSDSTPYGGTGIMKSVYLGILISHIVLSVVVIPFVLFSYLRAWMGDFVAHKKLVKFAFPLWLYVAVSGVVVYILISPYY